MRRRNWPFALAIVFVAQLVWYLVYTEQTRQALLTNAESLSQIFAEVQAGITDPRRELDMAEMARTCGVELTPLEVVAERMFRGAGS